MMPHPLRRMEQRVLTDENNIVMFTYGFLQHYWWFMVSVLGGILVYLLSVLGGTVLIFAAGRTEQEREMIAASSGRRWAPAFASLIIFGAVSSIAFPEFCITGFCGAYWLWVIVLAGFMVYAVSSWLQYRSRNVLSRNVFRSFMAISGVVVPFLTGLAISTCFTGADFTLDRSGIGDVVSPAACTWGNSWHGLEAVTNIWNICFGLAVFFLSMVLGALYMINNIDDENIVLKLRLRIWLGAFCFLILFSAFSAHLMNTQGFAVADDGTVHMEKYKYLHNFLDMPAVLVMYVAGIVLLLYGIVRTLASRKYRKGICYTGAGAVLTVAAVMMVAGFGGTSFYPSLGDMQSSLTISGSSASYATLNTMAYVSFIVILACIFYAWRSASRSCSRHDA